MENVDKIQIIDNSIIFNNSAVIKSDTNDNIIINNLRVTKSGSVLDNKDLVPKEYVDNILNIHINSNNPHNITKDDIGLSEVENLKMNLIAINNPSLSDNLSNGYNVGSRWFNRFNNTEYVCTSSTLNFATWKVTTTTIDMFTDDTIISQDVVWSSEKINDEFKNVAKLEHTHIAEEINDLHNSILNNSEIDANIRHRGMTNNPHNITKEQLGLSNIQNIKNNSSAITSPTEIDDETKGYNVGSRWLDVPHLREYVLIDRTINNAIWRETTFTTNDSTDEQIFQNKTIDARLNNILNITNNDIKNFASIDATKIANGSVTNTMFQNIATKDVLYIKNNLFATVEPQPFDDKLLGYSVGSRWIDINHNKEYVCLNNTTNNSVWTKTTNEPAEVNYGRNLGNGIGLYKNKTGPQLNFKSITEGNNIVLNSNNEELQVTSINTYSFLLNQVPIDVSSLSYQTIIHFPWINSEFLNYKDGKLLFYVVVNDRYFHIRLIDDNNAVLGILENIYATGYYSFNVSKPNNNSLIRTQIKKIGNGGMDPRIMSMILKYDT